MLSRHISLLPYHELIVKLKTTVAKVEANVDRTSLSTSSSIYKQNNALGVQSSLTLNKPKALTLFKALDPINLAQIIILPAWDVGRQCAQKCLRVEHRTAPEQNAHVRIALIPVMNALGLLVRRATQDEHDDLTRGAVAEGGLQEEKGNPESASELGCQVTGKVTEYKARLKSYAFVRQQAIR